MFDRILHKNPRSFDDGRKVEFLRHCDIINFLKVTYASEQPLFTRGMGWPVQEAAKRFGKQKKPAP